MSTTLIFKSPLPFQNFQAGATDNIQTDAHGLVTVNAGSDMAKALINYGWTIVTQLPTADPHLVNALWNNSGTVTISAG